MNIQLKWSKLQRKYGRKLVVPNMNCTNTQLLKTHISKVHHQYESRKLLTPPY